LALRLGGVCYETELCRLPRQTAWFVLELSDE
jgi:hypothetical protein